ncbi:hydrolase [Reticulibacter mediterranei]|uniref:Hydrolase n=1 Tax=Reticulibacter mediterranei TaxID=2778369 RepID=A0A8J3N5G4_9CHLR|nr:alpha/beta hydrolase [Reticulibacter mediterranei]GHO99039.1 hydrolase [Reticulibacter mediterranei]
MVDGRSNHGFVELAGERIFYETAGKGEVVVLMHGGLLDSRMWDEQFQFFAQHYQVIRYDSYGAGKSTIISANKLYTPYQELADLLTHLDIQHASLVGLSGGARFAIDMAIAYPERVQQLVLVSPGMSGYQFVDTWTHERGAIFEEAMTKGDVAGAVEQFLIMWTDGPYRSPEQVKSSVRERNREMATQAIAQGILELEWRELEPPAIGRLTEIRVPTLIIVGNQDTADIHAIGELLRKEVSGAELVKLPNVAHTLSMEVPGTFNDLVSQFLQRNV